MRLSQDSSRLPFFVLVALPVLVVIGFFLLQVLPEIVRPDSSCKSFLVSCQAVTRSCFKKNSSLHIWPKNFWTTFFRILPQKFYILSLKNSDDLIFLVIALFTMFNPSHHPLSSS